MPRVRSNFGIVGSTRTLNSSTTGLLANLVDAQLSIGSVTWPGLVFAGGNQTATSLKTLGETMVGYSAVSPSNGGTLTINSVSLGSYDYVIKKGNQTVSSFVNSDWFTNNQDTRSAIIVVDGNLTINSGQTFIPTHRKLFTFVYVRGDLTVNGTISMTARGANHTGTGVSSGATTAGAIRIATGTFSAVTDPQVPATGGSGGATTTGNANAGNAGTSGGTGGGGSGSTATGGTAGFGGTGTSYSGGSGGGGRGAGTTNGGNAEANGGAGGNAASSSGNYTGPGTGNPGGTGVGSHTSRSGTGGVLIIICTGTLSGSGVIEAKGVDGGSSSGTGGTDGNGGASGGGSVTVMRLFDNSTITPTASGGLGIAGGGPAGGNGGAGTARKLSL